jgi:HEAT repeat protein
LKVRPHPRWVLVLGCFVTALFLVTLGILWLRGREPVLYQGKTAGEWSSLVFAPSAQASNAAVALEAMGAGAVPDLVRLLAARDPLLQKPLRTLTRRLPAPARDLISPYLYRPSASSVRQSAARSLGIIGPAAKTAVPPLLRALRHSDQGVAWEAAGALSRIGKDSVPGLLLAMHDPRSTTRQPAAFALGELRQAAAEAAPVLAAALGDVDAGVRATAAASLGKIGLPAAAALLEVVAHGKGIVRETAGSLIVRLYSSWERFDASGGDSYAASNAARREAMVALAETGPPDELVAQVLGGVLRDPDPGVRLVALQHLSLAGTNLQPVLVGLAVCLSNESAAVRELAAKNLGNMGPEAKRATPALARLLRDNDAAVRTAAQEALGKLQAL